MDLKGLPSLSPATLKAEDSQVTVLSLADKTIEEVIAFPLSARETTSVELGTGLATKVSAREAVKDAKKLRVATQQRERRRKDRPDIILVGTILWSLTKDKLAKETIKTLGRRDIRTPVDVGTFCYRMTCACGRWRYAKPNDIFQVKLCRICQAQERKLRKRAKRPSE